MPIATMRQLLEAGIHFGHQTRRWNPKMNRYIFGQRNGIYIIDLQKTLRQLYKAYILARDTAANGGTVLFVGTKKQAQEPVAREAQRAGMFFINHRWLGGTLTNFQTVQQSVRRLRDLQEREANGKLELLSKKEAARLRKEKAKLEKNLLGIMEMHRLPSLMFVIDTKKENIAVREADRLGIPCIGVVDTNCDPDTVPLPIPGNDDAIRALNLYCSVMADAILEGVAQGQKTGAIRPRRGGAPMQEMTAGPAADAEAEVESDEADAVVADAEDDIDEMGDE